jgi:CO dehydrogenase maturation factor
MYEKIGVIANRIPSSEVTGLLDIGDLPLLAAIESDMQLAACDVKGENVFYLPNDAKIVVGAREALRAMNLL